MNNFYANVEILYDPAPRDRPVAVAGDEEARHGIVLAKNDIDKRLGIHTGQVEYEEAVRNLDRVNPTVLPPASWRNWKGTTILVG